MGAAYYVFKGHHHFIKLRNIRWRNSILRTATRVADNRGNVVPSPAVEEKKDTFIFSRTPIPALDTTKPLIQQAAGIKRPRREAEHSPSSNLEVKNDWSYIPTTPTRLNGVYMEKFYFGWRGYCKNTLHNWLSLYWIFRFIFNIGGCGREGIRNSFCPKPFFHTFNITF